MKSITFAFLTHNEPLKYLNSSIKHVSKMIDELYVENSVKRNIVIVDDYSTNNDTVSFLEQISNDCSYVKLYHHALQNNFSNQKNFMNDMCDGDWILNIDADEIISKDVYLNLEYIISENENVDMFALPRANVVTDITEEHLNKWNWSLTKIDGFDSPLIAWPDYQMRLYKNTPSIKWKNSVHEVLDGFETYAKLPPEKEFAILHYKDIDRQEKQNEFYAGAGFRK